MLCIQLINYPTTVHNYPPNLVKYLSVIWFLQLIISCHKACSSCWSFQMSVSSQNFVCTSSIHTFPMLPTQWPGCWWLQFILITDLLNVNIYYYYLLLEFFFTIGSKDPEGKKLKKVKIKSGVARHLYRPGTHGQRKSLETEQSWSVVWQLHGDYYYYYYFKHYNRGLRFLLSLSH